MPAPRQFTLKGPSSHEGSPIRGSRFPASVCTVSDDTEALEFVRKVRTEHPGLRHCAWAYTLRDGAYRSSDDGEPGGSAGRPILAQIEGISLVDACVAVVRYSSGIKLGVGGLIRAYGGAAREVLALAETEELIPMTELKVKSSYPDQALVERVFADAKIENREFGESVLLTVSVPATEVAARNDELRELSCGRVQVKTATSASPPDPLR